MSNPAVIAALATAIVSIIGALTALIQALRAKSSASIANGVAAHANNTINSHITREHNAFPIQPPTETGSPK